MAPFRSPLWAYSRAKIRTRDFLIHQLDNIVHICPQTEKGVRVLKGLSYQPRIQPSKCLEACSQAQTLEAENFYCDCFSEYP